jgi:hypothetical protein
MVARAKDSKPYIDWKNRPYAASRSDDTRRRAELWEAFNDFVRLGRGWITSPPGSRVATLETEVGSPLPAKLADLGYQLVQRGRVTRVAGAPSIDLRTEILFGPPSAFAERDVYDVVLPWAAPPPPPPKRRPA